MVWALGVSVSWLSFCLFDCLVCGDFVCGRKMGLFLTCILNSTHYILIFPS